MVGGRTARRRTPQAAARSPLKFGSPRYFKVDRCWEDFREGRTANLSALRVSHLMVQLAILSRIAERRQQANVRHLFRLAKGCRFPTL